MKTRTHLMVLLRCLTLSFGLVFVTTFSPASAEPLVIAASPSLATPLEALARAFESIHPEVQVKLSFDSGLDLRRMIAGMENSPIGQYFIGMGPIHLIAPGGDELITRLQQKYYVLPGTKRPYATVSLVMVVPEALVEAPASFDAMARATRMRVAVADPDVTLLGQKTGELFKALGIAEALNDRLDVATDAR
ncbi:MAG: substrate-binding domain-containing protein, partial [Nitrospira defluvii]|nr:substrate-binding domain-containing protein [Nitrospira defluvii]